RTSEKWKTNMGVDSTRGEVLTFDGDIFPSYYHATCGGFTEDASNLWKIDLAPLKGVECAFCKKAKHYRWRAKVSLNDIESALEKAGIKDAKDIISIEIESRNRSNRINNLVIKTAAGAVTVAGKDFRLAVGPNKLRSNNYEVNVENGQAVFNGTGWGHGVGMCQWGA
ncbi:MAG: SpoIID/LytB domain-containing protein, partial [Candidatus Omnitrophica bacterium]|nr:SpoIID/LytB domain-containing protein [Candidatus Omnitrophota bacterium]